MPAASDVVDAAGVADAAASDAVAPYVDAMLMGLLVPMGPLTPMRLLMLMGLLTPGADETVDDGGIVDADVTADADTDVTADADTTANADGVVGAVPSALTPHDRQYIQVQVQLSIHVLEYTDNQFSAMTTA